jgi:hypothetical protein
MTAPYLPLQSGIAYRTADGRRAMMEESVLAPGERVISQDIEPDRGGPKQVWWCATGAVYRPQTGEEGHHIVGLWEEPAPPPVETYTDVDGNFAAVMGDDCTVRINRFDEGKRPVWHIEITGKDGTRLRMTARKVREVKE